LEDEGILNITTDNPSLSAATLSVRNALAHILPGILLVLVTPLKVNPISRILSFPMSLRTLWQNRPMLVCKAQLEKIEKPISIILTALLSLCVKSWTVLVE
jgi:hypothetical protein